MNVNRDPRWGRNIEVPSEDPYLSGRVGVEMVRGIQEGDDDDGRGGVGDEEVTVGSGGGGGGGKGFVKLLASIKHFTAYSMENSDGKNRLGFDPTISLRDMSESYLPAFKAAIVEGGVLGMMCSYTSINGTALCESQTWIKEWARAKVGLYQKSPLCCVCTVVCVSSTSLCTVYCVYCVLYTVYCVLCTVYCTVYCVLCTVYCVLCTHTVYCVLCTVVIFICSYVNTHIVLFPYPPHSTGLKVTSSQTAAPSTCPGPKVNKIRRTTRRRP